MGRDESPTNSPAQAGHLRTRWAELHLRLLDRLRLEFRATPPFTGLTIGICLHIEPKTAVLCSVLLEGGAEVILTGSPGTTQDDVAAALQETGVKVFSRKRDDATAHLKNIRRVLEFDPHLLLDNGADLIATLLEARGTHRVVGATEETTTGGNRLREQLRDRVPFPVIVINDSPLKLIMENEHGVGPTVVEAFMRATNLLVPSRRYVVFGYGSVGRGIARCLRALGGHVSVVEPDPIRALEAALDGMLVTDMEDALANSEVFFTATGRPGVITGERIARLPDGAVLANAGHFSWEIDIAELKRQAKKAEALSAGVDLFTLQDGRRVALLAGGEMLNLAGGGGNPIETMDLGLALQAQSLRRLAESHKLLPAGAQPVPHDINLSVARAMVEELSRH
jgi:adenosylhomocysteinase